MSRSIQIRLRFGVRFSRVGRGNDGLDLVPTHQNYDVRELK